HMPILVAEGLCKAYGETRLLDGVGLSVHEGERVGLVGNNGSGKSTLARILVGEEQPDAGRVARRREATIRYLSQEPDLPGGRNARDVVLEGLGAWAEAFERHEELSRLIAAQKPGWEAYTEPQAAAAQEVERLGGWENSLRVDVLLQQLGLVEMNRSVDEMSGGERRRVALARLLVEEPSLAILDEPTNHLDADTIEWLETYLREQYRGALVLITHDRYVLDRVVNRTLEIDQGKVYSYDGGWHAYLEAKADRLAHADRAEANRQNLLRTELEWLRRSPKARTSKSKARVDRAEALRDATGPKAEQVAKFAAQTKRLGGTVLEAHGLGVQLGELELVHSLDLILSRGDRLGIVGPNGAGKTTLLRVLLGELEPTQGRVVIGANTKLAYFDQGRSGLIEDESVQQNVAPDRPQVTFQGRSIDIRSYLKRFLFAPHRTRDKVSSLSGGERARVALAKLLLAPANVLVLDEPTNDLDVATLSALEEMLVASDSTALIVSHDRYFLDRVATKILAFEGDGRVIAYAGNYSDYRDQRAAGRAERKRSSDKAGPKPKSVATGKGNKLSYKEKQELQRLPGEIERAETEAREVEALLNDPALYADRAEEVPAIVARQGKLQAQIDQMMTRWMELESKVADG
ncbi:MAG: ABC-F family ATP-binding cassette domain-containing protein, partial [Polyangiales bacterium]